MGDVIPKSPTVVYRISKKTVPTMYFIGVNTVDSSIMKVFPLWMQELSRPDVVLEGRDFKLHDDPEKYRAAVAQIKYDPLSLGALVTSHKINLFEAARDMFDYADPNAVTCGEVSSISKNGSALEGHAKDPISAGLSLDSLLGKDYFCVNRGHVLCFGAGGSTTAIVLHFAHKPNRGDRPERVVIVNRSPGRLEHLKSMIAGLNTDIQFEYCCNNNAELNDQHMAQMPPASLVINATGMGKDLPGSPITERVVFPERGIAWELNYRGELGFLHQALAQAESRHLTIEDGWLYFLYGWTQVIAQVLKVNIEGAMFERLADIAGRVCIPALRQRIVRGVVPGPACRDEVAGTKLVVKRTMR
jgi:shikimate 5-dehydrogenase